MTKNTVPEFKIRKIPRSLSLLLGSILSLQLSGCMTLPQPMLEPELNPESLKSPTNFETDFVDVDAGFDRDDLFLVKPYSPQTGKLPDKYIAPFSLNEAGIYDTLRLVIGETGMALNIEGGIQGSDAYGAISMFNIHGKLKDVMDELSESMGFFYTVRKNTVVIQPEKQFVVALPPGLSDDNMAGLTNTLQFLGAKETYVDRLGRSLVFKTNRSSLAKIEEYMTSVRETRSMIIYALNIFQVDLKHNSDTGIQWNKVAYAAAPGASISTGSSTGSALGKALTASGTSMGMGMVLSSANFSVDMLVNFLKTQGTVKAISQPRIGVMNGTKGTLSVGQTLTYVSKVGTTFATSLNQITTETKDLKTGVDIGVFGEVSDNTVYTHLDLKISDLVKINKYTAMGTDLTLPQTVNRDLNTVVRARPGDMILVGGITIDRNTREDNSGISKNGVSTEVTRSEMVLALRTKVVNFLPKKKENINPSFAAVENPIFDTRKPTEIVSVPKLQVAVEAKASEIKKPAVELPTVKNKSNAEIQKKDIKKEEVKKEEVKKEEVKKEEVKKEELKKEELKKEAVKKEETKNNKPVTQVKM